jgi:hypothetical protein
MVPVNEESLWFWIRHAAGIAGEFEYLAEFMSAQPCAKVHI